MSVYAFAITMETPTQTSVQNAGFVEIYRLPSMFQEIQNRTDTFKIRFQTRPPATLDSKTTFFSYSSIALFSFEEQDTDELISAIKDALNRCAPLTSSNQYVLRPMDIYEDIAFVVCDGDPTVYDSKVHNEWFSMPVSTEPLAEYDAETMRFNNIIYEFDGIGEPLKKYKGNNKHITWKVVKTSLGRYMAIFNGKKYDGIYDGSRNNIVYNAPRTCDEKTELDMLKDHISEQDREIRRLRKLCEKQKAKLETFE